MSHLKPIVFLLWGGLEEIYPAQSSRHWAQGMWEFKQRRLAVSREQPCVTRFAADWQRVVIQWANPRTASPPFPDLTFTILQPFCGKILRLFHFIYPFYVGLFSHNRVIIIVKRHKEIVIMTVKRLLLLFLLHCWPVTEDPPTPHWIRAGTNCLDLMLLD